MPLWFSDDKVSVSPFIGEYAPLQDIPIASVATAWDSPVDGSTILLVINEAFYFGDRLGHSLLCPNQLRDFGVIVNDCPSIFDANSTHSIILPDQQIELPLLLRGTISYLETRKPTEDELLMCERYELTSASPWNPNASLGIGSNVRDRFVDALRTEKDLIPSIPLELVDGFLPRLITALHLEQRMHAPSYERHEADVIAHAADLSRDVSEATSNREQWSTTTSGRGFKVSKEELARRWHTSLNVAARTLTSTTQDGLRYVDGPLERRLKTSQAHLRFPTLNCTIYTDTLFSKKRSVRGFTCAQLFTDGRKFFRIYPLVSKADAHHALSQFIQDVGIPKNVLVDFAPEERVGEWGRIIKHYHIKLRTTEPKSPWQNRAEAGIGQLKRLTWRVLRTTAMPIEFWCYICEWAARVLSLTAHDLPVLRSRTPEEVVTGRTPDISEFAHFDWGQWVWYRDVSSFPEPNVFLGRWLGVAHDVGQAMTYWILTAKGTVIARSSVIALHDYELRDPTVVSKLQQFTDGLFERKRLSRDLEEPFVDVDNSLNNIDSEEEELYTTPEMDEFTPESFDEYLSAQVILPVGEKYLRGEVIRRRRDRNGNPIGIRNVNPILDTREYEVLFPDGSTQSYLANAIAESLYSQVDAEGRTHAVMQELVDHERDDTAMTKEQMEASGQSYTTKGWRFLVSWKDGSLSWVPLRELKDSNPVEIAEYAIANQISEEPAFSWWVPHVMRKRDRIIQKLKSKKYWHRTHKYGIELPKTVKEALEIDKRTGTSFWRDAIEKEMRNVSVAFQFNDGDAIPPGYKYIDCHMVFDIKMVGLVRKCRLVAGGHMTDPPVDSVYASVVTRESVRIMFTIAALNDLDLLGADVQNAYINAKTNEKVYTTAGPEFGSNQGRPAIIVRALYGLKSSGARWRDHFSNILRDINFARSKADPDVWMRKARKPSGFEYWEYILCYVDDILVISHDPQLIMDSISKFVTFKPGSIEPPKSYLGADVYRVTIHDGNQDTPMKQVWAMSANENVKRAIQEVERVLGESGTYLPKKTETPLSSGYRPELDFSKELEGQQINYYQGLIGILRWIVELGRIDLIVPVSLLSRYLVSPREGHLQQLFHIFAYLKQFNRSQLLFDDGEPNYAEHYFHVCDWAEYYPDAAEPMPLNIPEALGHSVVTTCYCDADHAGCKVTRRSQTGIIIYVNKAPVVWYSKRQNTVESSTFGSEFIALKTAIDQIEALRYKLRMFGIPMDGPTSVFCDNEAVVKNTAYSESTLKRKHLSIAYHRCREAQAAGYVRVGWEKGDFNPADILTKLLTGPKMRALLRRLFYWNKTVSD